MTQPTAPQTQLGVLRAVQHPDLSPVLTHFCGRRREPCPDVPSSIRNMSARQRLESILWETQLQMFVTFSGGDPAVCFTEATFAGLKYMIERRGYEPWALMFDRQYVYSAGGAPAWHARDLEYRLLQQNQRLRSWAVRLGPGSDWLEEREWRIVRPQTAGKPWGIPLGDLRLVGLIVGDPTWTGARWANCVPAGSDRPVWSMYYPPVPGGLPRWWWDPANAQFQALTPWF